MDGSPLGWTGMVCACGSMEWDSLEAAWDAWSPLGRTGMGCPCGGMEWNAMPMGRTGMGFPCGGMGWETLGADWDGIALWQHGMGFPCGGPRDFHPMPLQAHTIQAQIKIT